MEACREKARAAGFEMKVTLEAVVGFVSRSQSAALTKVAAPARVVQRRTFDVTANDRRFLRSLRIAADETAEPVEVALDSAFCLIGHPESGGCRLCPVAEVVVANWLERVVQLVDEGNGRRDVQLHDLRFGDVVSAFTSARRLVPMRSDPHDAVSAREVEGAMVSCQYGKEKRATVSFSDSAAR